MGWVVWLVLSALALAGSYVTAAAIYPDRGTPDRLIATILIDSVLILVAVHVTGVFNALTPGVLGPFALLLFASVGAFSLQRLGGAKALVLLRQDLAAPRRVATDAWREREPAVIVIVIAAVVAGICCVMVYYFRSWTWDPVWYHVPKTDYAIQQHTVRWIDTGNPFTNGNPAYVEMLAVWNCVFQRDNQFDDSSQLPFLLLGALTVAAWARRVGASRPFAASAGAAWMCLPPVFLQAHSTHVDVAWNAVFTAAVFYTLRPPERRDRWMCYLCWGLFLGMKYTGAFHLALMAPLLVGRAAYEVWAAPGRRLRIAGDVLASFGLFLFVASFTYLRNWFAVHNPLYPFDWGIRALGWHFQGVLTMGSEYGTGPDSNPTFFGTPNAFQQLIGSWYDTNPFYCPDVRSGGFGAVFRWLLLPCVIVVICDLVRLRNWRRSAMVVWLFAQALEVPVPYMTRFVLSAGCAALVALAVIHADLRSPTMKRLLSCAFVALTWVGYQDAYRGWIVYPRYLRRAMDAPRDERAALAIDTFLWPTRWALERERTLQRGDVVTYDQSVHFIADLFSHDFSTRVMYVPSNGDPQAFVRRVRSVRARWVGVTEGSSAEAALREAGAQFLFVTPASSMAMWRMP